MHVLLNRRVTIAAWAAGIACVCYGVYLPFILDELASLMRRLGPLDPTAPLDPAVARMLPLAEIALVGSILPIALGVHALRCALRRRYRMKHDRCVACGHALISWWGRCPGCGVRIGPDPPRARLEIAHPARARGES